LRRPRDKMKVIPVLIRPKIMAFANRWRGHNCSKNQIWRDIIIYGFSLLLMFGLYKGTVYTLSIIQGQVGVAFLPPALPLGLIFLLLMVLLFFSSAVSSLGVFYMGKDLEMLMATPVSKKTFFLGKFSEVLVASSWMAMVFGLPLLIGFGAAYQAPYSFYVLAPLLLAPFSIIPSALALAGVTVFSRLISINRTREILASVLLAGLVMLYFFSQMVSLETANISKTDEVLRIVGILSSPNTAWLPSYWLSVALGELLTVTGKTIWPEIVLLVSIATFSLSLAYILVRFLHEEAFSMALSGKTGLIPSNRVLRRIFTVVFGFVPRRYRALIGKEYRLFSRDMAQAIQLIILLGISIIYLYNFRAMRLGDTLSEESVIFWKAFLLVSNVALGAFVITAICTRFVFPSVSLEGQSFWILQKSPVAVAELLQAKFLAWFLPVSFIGATIFAAGGLAINAAPVVIVLNTLSSFIISFGIVGLGLGFGAFFSRFDWEHPSQLAVSFGSLIFMLCGVLLVFINLIPVTFMVLVSSIHQSGAGAGSNLQWYTFFSGILLLMLYANFAATRWALRLGQRALLERAA